MAKPFSVATEEQRFHLPPLTKQQIAELMRHLDATATDVIIMMIAEGHQRELGTPDRDYGAEIDAINAHLGL